MPDAFCASFDIFGTLLFRRISRPAARFAVLAGAGEAGGWAQRRMETEKVLAQKIGPDLYSLDEIYERMGPGGPSAEAEKEMELSQCFAVTAARRRLAAARQRGQRILFASDMYLPPDFLRQLLEVHGLWQKGDRIYVSHEQGAAKHGGLFLKICRELSLAPNEIEHIGDNLRSDVLVPRRLGIRALHFRETEPTRYEAEWMRNAGENEAAVADAIRAARLQSPEKLDARGQVVWETAIGVAAPLFTAYVIWLEARARDLGLERLYFISRDGLIFKKIYDRLFSAEAARPESRYLYGSRQAWSGVQAARLESRDVDALTRPGTGMSFGQFLRRCGLDKECRLPALAWSRPPLESDLLEPDQLAELKAFLSSGVLRERVQQAGREKSQKAAQYLRQEGLGSGRYGLVDLGWFGNLQEWVAALLPENPPTMGFYLDLRLRPRIQREGRAEAWVSALPFRGIDLASSITLLEILAGSSEGSVIGYQKTGQGWSAVADPARAGNGPEQWADLQHEAILKFVEELLQQPGGARNLAHSRPVALRNLQIFLCHPSRREADVYGEICFTSNQEGGEGVILAPALHLAKTWKIFFQGFWKRQVSWPPGMIARAGGVAKGLLLLRYRITQGVNFVRSWLGSPG